MGLVVEFDRFARHYRASNPPTEEPFTAFLREMSAKGKLDEASEEEWIELGRKNGLEDDEIAELVEQAASWLDKSSSSLQPAAWTGLAPRVK